MEKETVQKTEQIGKVKLDYRQYPGEDFYCDGTVEDELLAIVKEQPATSYGQVIGERKQWPILYHLSAIRENIVDWIPMQGTEKVLEVGSGCGAITGALARKAGSVTCVELSKKRSTINAYRHRDCDNVTIHVGNFQDIEPELPADYDYIFLIGVFEYGCSYIGGEDPFADFLKKLLSHKKSAGRIILAIENQYGLKYFAGCKEDHLGSFFSGIEHYTADSGVQTFSRNGLEKIFDRCGVEQSHFYYPYPDYKLMHTLYSDEHLPQKGELSDNLRNFDQDRMVLFDEQKAFDGIVENGLFPVFSNSYLVVLGEPIAVQYVKYSNDRAPQYAIKTEIVKVNGKKSVRKYPMTQEANEHVLQMARAYEQLCERYRGSKLHINSCTIQKAQEGLFAEFDYVSGTPLLSLMDEALRRGGVEALRELFRVYVERIGFHSTYPVSDFDVIFQNVLVEGDEWTLIDYEWTFAKAMPVREQVFRAMYYYLRDQEKMTAPPAWLLEELAMTQEQAQVCWEQEKQFQQQIRGGLLSMAQLRDLIGHRLMQPLQWMGDYRDSYDANRVQIYEDTTGEGYREDCSYFVHDAYRGEQFIAFTTEVAGDVRRLRIDPAMDSCMVKILEMTWNESPMPLAKRKFMTVNGRMVKPADPEKQLYQPSIVFATTDPNIDLDLSRLTQKAVNELSVKMEIVRIPLTIAADMVGTGKKLHE